MTPEQHDRALDIFSGAMDLPPAERNAFVHQACGDDENLRDSVLKLLAAYDPTITISGVKECPGCKRCFDDPIGVCPGDGKPLHFAMPGSLLIDRKYRIERLIGRGGMGAVYLVNHVSLNKRFALKLISLDGPIPASYRRNFEIEAQLLGRLNHPNIVAVTDYGIDPRGDGMPYLVMDYLEGRTVRQLLQEHECAEHQRGLPFPEAIRVLREVAEGVDAANARGIAHGDLKPANLFLAKDPVAGESVKIVDFGLARLAPAHDDAPTLEDLAGNRTTGSGSIRGTPPYMAHELFRGEDASPSSDRFACGVLAYELLTRDVPFGLRYPAIKDNQRNPPPPPSARNPDLPPELDAPILALLNRVPDQRPSSAAIAVAAMEQAWLSAEQRKWRTREVPRRLLFAAIGAIAILLLAGLSAGLRVAQILEDRTVDARFATLPPRPPDPRLFLVALDHATLAQNYSRALADWDADFARMINQLFKSGASAVAIDFQLPAKWSLSPDFGMAVTAQADRLALAKFSTPSGGVIGTECISPLVAYAIGPKRFAAAFGFVNIDDDPDHVVRRTRVLYLDRDGREQPSFAARAVLAAAEDPSHIALPDRWIWIDYATRPQDIPRLSWKDVAGTLQSSPDFFRDRLVVIGDEDTASNDKHHVPAGASPDLVSGTAIQTLIANTILHGFPIRDFALTRCLLVMAAACFTTLALALRFPHRRALALIVAAAAFFAYALIAFALFRASQIMLAFIAPELAIVLSAVAAWLLPSRLKPYPTSL